MGGGGGVNLVDAIFTYWYVLNKSKEVLTLFSNPTKNLKIYYFYAVQFEYKKLPKSDCLVSMALHSMVSDGTPDHNNCMEWCNNNSSCGGFALYKSTCYFKGDSCKNDIGETSISDLYLKQG